MHVKRPIMMLEAIASECMSGNRFDQKEAGLQDPLVARAACNACHCTEAVGNDVSKTRCMNISTSKQRPENEILTY